MPTCSGQWLRINKGETVTYTANVTLETFCRYAGEIQIANGTDPTAASWQTLERDIAWTLSGTYGAKTVSARYRIEAGSESAITTASITYSDINDLVQGGNQGKAMKNLQTLASNCSSWQSWVGVVSATTALPRIHLDYYGTPDLFPHILLYGQPNWSPELIAVSGFAHSGSFRMIIEDQPKNIVPPIEWEVELPVFRNHVETFIEELLTDQGVNGAFCIDSIDQVSQYQISDEQEVLEGNIRDFSMRVEFAIRWR